MALVKASDLTSWYNRINNIRTKENISLNTISIPTVQNSKITAIQHNNVVSQINSLYSNTYLSFADQSTSLFNVNAGDIISTSPKQNIELRLSALEKICGNNSTTTEKTQTCSTNSTCATNSQSTNSTNSTFTFSFFTCEDCHHCEKFTFGTNVVFGTAASNNYGKKTIATFATFNTQDTFGEGDATNSTKSTNSTFNFRTNSTQSTQSCSTNSTCNTFNNSTYGVVT